MGVRFGAVRPHPPYNRCETFTRRVGAHGIHTRFTHAPIPVLAQRAVCWDEEEKLVGALLESGGRFVGVEGLRDESCRIFDSHQGGA